MSQHLLKIIRYRQGGVNPSDMHDLHASYLKILKHLQVQKNKWLHSIESGFVL